MNILKLVGKGTFSGKAAQTGINCSTRRTFSQVISNKSADIKVSAIDMLCSFSGDVGRAKNRKLYSH